jgi:hypothetical protein
MAEIRAASAFCGAGAWAVLRNGRGSPRARARSLSAACGSDRHDVRAGRRRRWRWRALVEPRGGEQGAQRVGAGFRQSKGKRHQHEAAGQVLHSIADPQPAVGSEPLEQDGAADHRHQRADREHDADRAIDAAGDPALDDKGDPADAEQQPCRLAPGHAFVEDERGEQRG